MRQLLPSIIGTIITSGVILLLYLLGKSIIKSYAQDIDKPSLFKIMKFARNLALGLCLLTFTISTINILSVNEIPRSEWDKTKDKALDNAASSFEQRVNSDLVDSTKNKLIFKKEMKKIKLFIALLCASTLLLTSCGNEVRNIPSGYIAKKLTPSGFDPGFISPGQNDIGEKASNGQYSTLVLLEASTITIKEEFHQSDPKGDNEDHRIMTKKSPLTVDVYIQVELPTDPKLRDYAFASMTPTPWAPETRMSVITLEDIYTKFAKLTVRGKCRGIFTHYEDYDSVMKNFDKINAECFQSIIKIFEASSTPLKVISAQISNIKPDQKIWDSKNDLEAANIKAASIGIVNKAMRENPNYIEARKWDVLEKMVGSPNAPNITLIFGDDNKVGYTLPIFRDTTRRKN